MRYLSQEAEDAQAEVPEKLLTAFLHSLALLPEVWSKVAETDTNYWQGRLQAGQGIQRFCLWTEDPGKHNNSGFSLDRIGILVFIF